MKLEQTIIATTYQELVKHEVEIMRRIEGKPNGHRLLLLDPLRLLRELGVEVSDEAKSEWKRVAGSRLFSSGGHESAYDHVAASDPAYARMKIKVKGIFVKDASP